MNFKFKPTLLFWLLFDCLGLFVPFSSYAQLNAENLTRFSEKDGLPGAQVNAVLADSLGYIWAGTVNGLVRYDGYEFRRFYNNLNDSASIHGLIVNSLFQDHRGGIWIGTSPSFLNLYNPVTNTFSQFNFTHLVSHPSNVELSIQCMCEDNDGRVYFGVNTYHNDPISSALLYKDENDGELKKFITPDSLDIRNVYRCAKDKKGNIALLSNSGLFLLDVKRRLKKIYSFKGPFSSNSEYFTDLSFDENGHLWIITEASALYELNLETGKLNKRFISSAITRESDFFPNRLIIDKDENIWTGTKNGIQFFNKKTGIFSKFNNGLKNELEHLYPLDLAFDSFGTLWIGSTEDGLIKYEDKPQLKSYTSNKAAKNALTYGWANIIYESSDGKIWIATGGSNTSSGLNVLDTRTGRLKPIPFSIFTNRIGGVSAFWENFPGEFYMAAYNSLYLFSSATNKLTPARLPGVPESSYIAFHLMDERENEWICTFGGLYKRAKGSSLFTHYDLSKVKGGDAASNAITSAYESKKHGLWLLTNNGLFLYNYSTGKIERHGYNKSEGDVFATQDINSFYEEPGGTAWVGTWQGGLSSYNIETKQIKTYTRNDGLPSMSIQAILADEPTNSLWLSTFEGLSRFNLNTKQFNNFSIADGIQSQLFADNSFLKTSKGLFAFGGSNGITIFNPNDITKNSVPPKVFLTDLKLFNKSIIPGKNSILKKPVYATDRITLAYDQNNIALDFIALHYSNPQKNSYAYKLENYDNAWREIGNLHTAFYPNLPPGEYIFYVKASNNNGVWNEKGATLKIVVTPPIWKTKWAYFIYGLLFIVIAFAIDHYLRQRVIQKERERNRARELEQAKEIETAYYKLEETYKTLKAAQSQLIQSEKMASLGELTAGIAHEIQNPLNFVNNFSETNSELLEELIGEIKADKKEQAIAIAKDVKDNELKIVHHGKRADAIVKGMLQHSRASTGQKEPTDINALADEYLRLAFHGIRVKDASFNVTIKRHFDEGLDPIEVIPQDIGRVLLNLFSNAFYAVNEKKKQLNGTFDPAISVTTKKENDKVTIAVRDNGIGIPQKAVDKIFQPFYTTKPAGQGTGLGLSLSYDIIKAHGGELKVETKEGEGAEFIIQL